MDDRKARRELLMLLGQALHSGLPPDREARLHEIMLQYDPRYSTLPKERWVDAGLILAGSWRLEEALAGAPGAD